MATQKNEDCPVADPDIRGPWLSDIKTDDYTGGEEDDDAADDY
jgi:hypothetical protein